MIKKKFNINISQSIGDTKLITSFKMNPEIISIFGPSGSGKTSISVSYTHLRAHET